MATIWATLVHLPTGQRQGRKSSPWLFFRPPTSRSGKCKVVPAHCINDYGEWGLGVGFQFFLMLALDEGDWSASRHVHFNPGETAHCTHCTGGFGGPRGRSGRVQNPQKWKKSFLFSAENSTTIPWSSKQLRSHHIAPIFGVKLSLFYVFLNPKVAAILFSETSIQLKTLKDSNLQNKNRFLAYLMSCC